MTPVRSGRSQRGIVLVIALIMLLAITLMVVTTSNIADTNMRIVGNLEAREQARTAAIAALEEAISSSRFATSPGAMFLASCDVANRLCFDTNNDGYTDVTVQMADPECVSVIPKKNTEIDKFGDDVDCHFPGEDGTNIYSLCAASVWELEATATDVVTGAEVTVRQGVSILTSLNNIDTACPT